MSQHSKKENANSARNRNNNSNKQQQQQQQNVDNNQRLNANNKHNKNNIAAAASNNKKQQSLGGIGDGKDVQPIKRSPRKNKDKDNNHKAKQTNANNVLLPAATPKQKEKERAEREAIVLWKHPVKTLQYSMLELSMLLKSTCKKLLQQRLLLLIVLIAGLLSSFVYYTPGRHQVVLDVVRNNTWFFIYWLGLGVLSSVGLGTGLHTFLLYLGPHIASVTLAAYECNSLNFPKPPYPDDIICPEEPYVQRIPNLWSIMAKVRLESFLWGAGTALGELPPYFMAKAARLSGYDPDDAEELAEFEALKAKRNQKNLSLMDRGKLFMERVVERIGFFGILACASIPNPLFDLAGITCGHFLVPFWTFFGATLIGKAIVKMHLQKIFIIIAFNETLIERAVDLLGFLPVFGKKLQEPFKGLLENQKHRLHRQKNAPVAESGNLLSKFFEMFVICMVCYFVVSILNSLAQSYHKRIHKKPAQLAKKASKKALLAKH